MKRICGVCGRWAWSRLQWFNQDKGYSICENCAADAREMADPDTMFEMYGIEGVHYRLPKNFRQPRATGEAQLTEKDRFEKLTRIIGKAGSPPSRDDPPREGAARSGGSSGAAEAGTERPDYSG